MSFKQFAGTAVIPTLSRLVLALAFVTQGYNKLTTQATFTAEEKAILESHGVAVTAQEPEAMALDASGTGGVRLVSFRQEDPAEPPAGDPAGDPAADDDGDQPVGIPAPAEPPAGDDDAGEAAEPAAVDTGTYTARAMYRITLYCDGAGWPMPKFSAWLAALTELLGGALLLIGFLSRVWGLGLAITMASAFYLVTVGQFGVLSTSPFTFARELGQYNAMVAQLALLVLALGVTLTGPGPLSLDRFIFRSRKPEAGEIEFDSSMDDG
jgi:uncharacterized membrane protein YphA (DoxX/SURF4 family)